VSEFELEPVRVRVAERERASVPALRGEARTAAVAAVGGLVLGAATIKSSQGRLLPRRKRQPKVVASRSFLVDVHLLGK